MAQHGKERRAELARLVAEQEASGLNVSRFCRERGIASWSLYDWKRRRRSKPKASSSSSFVELRVARPSVPTAPMALDLPSGLRVQVPQGFDAGELRRLLEVLASC